MAKASASKEPSEQAGHGERSSPVRRGDQFAPRFEDETKTPQEYITSSENEEPSSKGGKPRSRAKKGRKASPSSQTSVPSLRPAKDILSRIRHDPELRQEEYVIGYADRHQVEPIELSVSDWKGGDAMDDEDWIPQHRILYFRKIGDVGGRKVWDREARLDRLFGSGIRDKEDSSGNPSAGG